VLKQTDLDKLGNRYGTVPRVGPKNRPAPRVASLSQQQVAWGATWTLIQSNTRELDKPKNLSGEPILERDARKGVLVGGALPYQPQRRVAPFSQRVIIALIDPRKYLPVEVVAIHAASFGSHGLRTDYGV
jgi:hypothetical protein